MKKAGLTVFLLLVAAFGVFAQKSPAAYGAYNYYETDGYCIVEGVRLHYWLYNTYRYNDGDGRILWKAFMDYAESLGYTIDYGNWKEYSPNTSLADSVKNMMTAKNSDVSMTIVTYTDRSTAMIINSHEAREGYYWTEVYPLIK